MEIRLQLDRIVIMNKPYPPRWDIPLRSPVTATIIRLAGLFGLYVLRMTYQPRQGKPANDNVKYFLTLSPGSHLV